MMRLGHDAHVLLGGRIWGVDRWDSQAGSNSLCRAGANR